jgi:hypothetical protein
MKKFVFGTMIFLLMCGQVSADELSELKVMLKQMRIQMKKMADRIEQLEKGTRVSSGQPTGPMNEIREPRARVLELEATEKQDVKSFFSTLNPQVSVLGDLIYKATDEDGGEGDNDFNLREVELAFSANVDTYARADVIIAVENEDGSTEVALEEGYMTLLETPVDNLQGKFGKFRPFFGKANKMHLHQLPWVDYPLVVQNFLGEEGFSEAGGSLSYLIPNPFDVFSEVTVEAFNNGGTVFGGAAEGETIYLTHLKNFFDITDDTSLEAGGSFAFGETGDGQGAETQLTGVDLTLNTQLFDNRRTISHTEALFNTREQPGDDDLNSWGMFTSLEQQLTDRFWVFGRYDYSQTPTASNVDAHAYSGGLTFAQSEYVFWRAMYTRADNEVSGDVDTVWLQLDFSIGPHKPHAYR